jgi:FkbM family methyltransferase
MSPWLGRRMLRAVLPKSMALRLRQEWMARRVVQGKGHREGEIQLLPSLVGKADVCWDIGANTGTYTIELSRLSSKVFAFEPVPHSLNTVRQVKRLARLDNVEIRALAMSNAPGHARFSVPTEGFYGGFYLASLDPQGELEVETATIDGLIEQGVPEPDFIKCDVEGAEALVIEGAGHLLSRRRPIWLLETFDANVLPLMESFGYTTHVREADNSLTRVSSFRPQSRNYIFLPVKTSG